MPETLRWRKAFVFSAVLHCVLFVCAGAILLREFLPPQEKLLEIALVADMDFAISTSGGGGGGGGGSPKQTDLSIAQNHVPKVGSEGQKRSSQFSESYSESSVQKHSADGNAPLAAEGTAVSDGTVQSGGGSGSGQGSGSGSGQGSGSGSGQGGGSGSGQGGGSGSGQGGGSGSGIGDGRGGAISPPGVLGRVKPEYPSAARRNGIEGIVYLRVLIMENGRAGDVGVASSSGDALLDDAAAAAIVRWRFIPAKDKNGNSIACYTQIPVVFRLTDA